MAFVGALRTYGAPVPLTWVLGFFPSDAMNETQKEICIHCGKLIWMHAPVKLATLAQLSIQKVKPDQFVDFIAKTDQLPRELVQDYVDHRMSLNCNKTDPPCPECGAALKTWHGTICAECGWKRDPDKPLPNYYSSPRK